MNSKKIVKDFQRISRPNGREIRLMLVKIDEQVETNEQADLHRIELMRKFHEIFIDEQRENPMQNIETCRRIRRRKVRTAADKRLRFTVDRRW